MKGFAVFLWFLGFCAFLWMGSAAGDQDYTGASLMAAWVVVLLGGGFLVFRRAA